MVKHVNKEDFGRSRSDFMDLMELDGDFPAQTSLFWSSKNIQKRGPRSELATIFSDGFYGARGSNKTIWNTSMAFAGNDLDSRWISHMWKRRNRERHLLLVCEKIKRIPKTRHILVFAFTGLTFSKSWEIHGPWTSYTGKQTSVRQWEHMGSKKRCDGHHRDGVHMTAISIDVDGRWLKPEDSLNGGRIVNGGRPMWPFLTMVTMAYRWWAAHWFYGCSGLCLACHGWVLMHINAWWCWWSFWWPRWPRWRWWWWRWWWWWWWRWRWRWRCRVTLLFDSWVDGHFNSNDPIFGLHFQHGKCLNVPNSKRSGLKTKQYLSWLLTLESSNKGTLTHTSSHHSKNAALQRQDPDVTRREVALAAGVSHRKYPVICWVICFSRKLVGVFFWGHIFMEHRWIGTGTWEPDSPDPTFLWSVGDSVDSVAIAQPEGRWTGADDGTERPGAVDGATVERQPGMATRWSTRSPRVEKTNSHHNLLHERRPSYVCVATYLYI